MLKSICYVTRECKMCRSVSQYQQCFSRQLHLNYGNGISQLISRLNPVYLLTRKIKIFYHFAGITYLIPIKIRAPLIFAPLIFAPLIFAHPQILRPFNFRAPLLYCKFAVFSLICGIFSPFNLCAFVLRELAHFNFRAG